MGAGAGGAPAVDSGYAGTGREKGEGGDMRLSLQEARAVAERARVYPPGYAGFFHADELG